MATQAKEPANCTSQVLFVGNARILPNPEDAEIMTLNIDVLASKDYTSETFETVWLYLKIETAGVTIVSHALHNPAGKQWSLWDQSNNTWVPTSWPPPPISTNYLRMTDYGVTLRRGPAGLMDGATYYFDLKGFPDGGAIEFRAWADATKITAEAESCTIHFTDFHVKESLPGYLT